jgi:enoyl-CoA hydratase/carnithine racemase
MSTDDEAAPATHIQYEADPPVVVVRLDRPEKLNAFTFAMVRDLRRTVDRAAADPAVAGIVVTGAGRAFCAGLDAGDLARSAAGTAPVDDTVPDPDELPALFSYLLRVPKPVVAAVNGVAAGGGMVLAMMCDLRFGAETASFTTAFSRRGLVAEHLTSWLLPRQVGTSAALDLLWSARRIDSAEAFRLGLLDRLVPGDQVVEAAVAYVRDLAANVSPRSVAVMKAQVYRHWALALAEAASDADHLTAEALRHPDAAEGVASFVERRPPRFEEHRSGPIAY